MAKEAKIGVETSKLPTKTKLVQRSIDLKFCITGNKLKTNSMQTSKLEDNKIQQIK